MKQLLLLDGDDDRRDALTAGLRERDVEVRALDSSASPARSLKGVDLVLLACEEGVAGRASTLRRADPLVPVLVFSPGSPSAREAAELGRARVYDVLRLGGPEDLADVMPRLEAAARRQLLRRESSRVAPEILGVSQAMDQVRRYIGRAAASEANVLLVGESGTGKELVARAIHEHGTRCDGPFVAVNCSAIPESLLESELFGHERGAFTGAVARTRGTFEQADGGTLFFDEIGEMPAPLQAKLLRVLQAPPGERDTVREFTRVGGEGPSRADVRLVFATNRQLAGEVEQGGFRDDLYQRINVLDIRLPELRNRREDVALLARHFLNRYAAMEGKEGLAFDDVALDVLTGYDFPLNVRELEGMIHQLVVLKEAGSTVVLGDLPPEVFGGQTDASRAPAASSVLRTLAEVQDEHVRRVLAHVGGNKSRAARILGITRQSLDRKLKRALGAFSEEASASPRGTATP